MTNKAIKNVRQNRYGEIVGECEGRLVKFTYSTGLWFWDDEQGGGYIFGAKVEKPA